MPSKTRRFVVCSGFGPSHNLGVYNNNVDTIERAFVERYFLCKDGSGFRPAHSVKSRTYHDPLLVDFRDKVMACMPNLPRLTRQQVVDRYSGPKRRVYAVALESLNKVEVSEVDARLSSFVKFEKQDVQKAPRVINPRTARYNLKLGQYIKHAEHHFFRAINKAFGGRTHATVIKGFNADQSAAILRSKWDLFDKPVAVGLDASKFDMHVSVQALSYEHSFYTSLFPGSQELRKLLSWQKINQGTAYAPDGAVDFKMIGTRSSGDLNTSLGNCLIMCSLIHAYAAERGVNLELCNNGDDCVVVMEQASLATFSRGLSEWFVGKGFSMVVESPVTIFERIEFCQTHPVKLATGWRMLRNHTAVLTKDPMCLVSVQNDRVYRKWLDAVGTCGLALTAGAPVQSALYGAFKKHGVPAGKLLDYVNRNTSMSERINGLHSAAIDAEARVSYYYAFGVLPDVQKAMEEYYSLITIGPLQTGEVERADLHLEPGLIVNTH